MMLKEKKKKHRESGLCSSKCLRVRLLKKKNYDWIFQTRGDVVYAGQR